MAPAPGQRPPAVFVEGPILGGEDEQEASYAYSPRLSRINVDFEGKEVDNYVVKKLLANNEHFSPKIGA